MNAVLTKNFQQEFFDKLSLRFDKRGKMVLDVAELLGIGRDAVYRRMRADTVLTADELISLARHYDIKLDERHPEQADDPQIAYPPGMEDITTELEYYRLLEEQCLQINSLPEVSVDYATPELPLYYELLTPMLLAFKTYVYGLTTWNFKKWKGKGFRKELIDPEVFRIADRIAPLLFDLPGRELWSIGILDITLRQIEHAVEIGQLNDQEVIDIMFQEIEDTIVHMEEMTHRGKRFVPGEANMDNRPDFRVYHNELTNTNNVVIIKSPLQSFVFSTFVNPNYLVSWDERIQRQMNTWFDNLVQNSNVLNVDSAKHRQRFFATLRRTVAATKKRVDTLL